MILFLASNIPYFPDRETIKTFDVLLTESYITGMIFSFLMFFTPLFPLYVIMKFPLLSILLDNIENISNDIVKYIIEKRNIDIRLVYSQKDVVMELLI